MTPEERAEAYEKDRQMEAIFHEGGGPAELELALAHRTTIDAAMAQAHKYFVLYYQKLWKNDPRKGSLQDHCSIIRQWFRFRLPEPDTEHPVSLLLAKADAFLRGHSKKNEHIPFQDLPCLVALEALRDALRQTALPHASLLREIIPEETAFLVFCLMEAARQLTGLATAEDPRAVEGREFLVNMIMECPAP